MLVPLRVNCDVLLFWMMSVTLLPMFALMRRVPVPVTVALVSDPPLLTALAPERVMPPVPVATMKDTPLGPVMPPVKVALVVALTFWMVSTPDVVPRMIGLAKLGPVPPISSFALAVAPPAVSPSRMDPKPREVPPVWLPWTVPALMLTSPAKELVTLLRMTLPLPLLMLVRPAPPLMAPPSVSWPVLVLLTLSPLFRVTRPEKMKLVAALTPMVMEEFVALASVVMVWVNVAPVPEATRLAALELVALPRVMAVAAAPKVVVLVLPMTVPLLTFKPPLKVWTKFPRLPVPVKESSNVNTPPTPELRIPPSVKLPAPVTVMSFPVPDMAGRVRRVPAAKEKVELVLLPVRADALPVMVIPAVPVVTLDPLVMKRVCPPIFRKPVDCVAAGFEDKTSDSIVAFPPMVMFAPK